MSMKGDPEGSKGNMQLEGVTLSILGYTEERLMKDTRHTFPSLVILFFSRNAAIASM